MHAWRRRPVRCEARPQVAGYDRGLSAAVEEGTGGAAPPLLAVSAATSASRLGTARRGLDLDAATRGLYPQHAASGVEAPGILRQGMPLDLHRAGFERGLEGAHRRLQHHGG